MPGLGVMALPAVGMIRRSKPGLWAGGSFFLASLAVTFQLYIPGRHALLEHTSTLLDTANARFWAAGVLLLAVTLLNLAAVLRARRRS